MVFDDELQIITTDQLVHDRIGSHAKEWLLSSEHHKKIFIGHYHGIDPRGCLCIVFHPYYCQSPTHHAPCHGMNSTYFPVTSTDKINGNYCRCACCDHPERDLHDPSAVEQQLINDINIII